MLLLQLYGNNFTNKSCDNLSTDKFERLLILSKFEIDDIL